MRLNKYIALATGMSRRSADAAIDSKKVQIDGIQAVLGQEVHDENIVTLDGKVLKLQNESITLKLHKPAGYVCSREGQGSKTIYDLLPKKYKSLKPVGRLDKDTSGLILLTNDGNLANELTHPRYQKKKVYEVLLNKTLALSDKKQLLTGVNLNDGLSKFMNIKECSTNKYEVTLSEGKNRQIRRSFNALGYKIEKLHRISVGAYKLNDLEQGKISIL